MTTQRWPQLLSQVLYFLVVVLVGILLPIFHVRQFLSNSLEEILKEEKRRFFRESLVETKATENSINLLRTIRRFLRLKVLRNPEFRKELSNLSMLIPGAFQVFVWNQAGDLLWTPEDSDPQHSESFAFITRRFLRLGVDAEELFKRNPHVPEVRRHARALQDYLGPTGDWQDHFSTFQSYKRFFRNGQETYLTWDIRAYRLRPDTPRLPANVPWGFSALIVPDRLPPDFLTRLALKGYSELLPKEIRTLALIDGANPRRSLLQSGLPLSCRFAGRLASASQRHSDRQVFPFDRFLVRRVPATLFPHQALFLLKPIPDLLQNAPRFRRHLDLAMNGLMGLSVLVGVLLVFGGSRRISLSRHVAGLLLIAIILPTSAILWLGTIYWQARNRFDHQDSQATARSQLRLLPQRRAMYLATYGHQLRSRVRRFLDRNPTEQELFRFLASERQTGIIPDIHRGRISEFFLGNDRGKLLYSSVKQPPELTLVIQLLLDRYCSATLGGSDAGNLMGKAILEEISRVKNTGLVREIAPQENCFNRFLWARSEVYILPFTTTLAGKRRVLFLLLHEAVFEQNFLREELKTGLLASLQRDQPGDVQLAVTSSGEDIIKFGRIDLLIIPQLRASLFTDHETLGTVTIDNDEWAFYSTPRNLLHSYRVVLLRKSSVLQAISRNRGLSLLLVFLLSLLGITLTGIHISRLMVHPLRDLSHSFNRVAKGDLSTTLRPEGEDEIARLGRYFNEMVGDLREKERMELFLSDAVVQAIRTETRSGTAPTEQREITIMLSDIRNFTTLSERYAPEIVFASLNAYFNGIEPIIRENGGQIQKYIGDAVYVIFPYPGTSGAQRAVKAALAIQAFLERFNPEREAAGAFPLNVGFGITSGPVLWGKIGSEERQDYIFVGEEIARAARLEALSKRGRHSHIILGPATSGLLAEHARIEPLERSSEADLKAVEFVAWKTDG